MAERAFDKAKLAPMDIAMRQMMERHYDLCIYNCNEKKEEVYNCKKACFTDIQVPYRYVNHIGRDNEESNYRKCLAKRPTFPAVGPDDFTACSNNLFHERLEVMTKHIADEAGKIL